MPRGRRAGSLERLSVALLLLLVLRRHGMPPSTVRCNVGTALHATHRSYDASWSWAVEVYHGLPSPHGIRAVTKASRHRLREAGGGPAGGSRRNQGGRVGGNIWSLYIERQEWVLGAVWPGNAGTHAVLCLSGCGS